MNEEPGETVYPLPSIGDAFVKWLAERQYTHLSSPHDLIDAMIAEARRLGGIDRDARLREDMVILAQRRADLEKWLAHSEQHGTLHTCIPNSVVRELIEWLKSASPSSSPSS